MNELHKFITYKRRRELLMKITMTYIIGNMNISHLYC